MGFRRSFHLLSLLSLLVITPAGARRFGLPPGLRNRFIYSLSIPRPRLSGYLFAFWSSPSVQYRRLLEEQRDLLERQLRQTREELAQVRKQYQELQKRKNAQVTSEQTKLYHERIAALERELEEAAGLRHKLEKALDLEKRKVTELEAKIKKLEHKRSAKDVADHQAQLQALRQELEASATEQLQELRITMEQRMQEALKHARVAAEQEKQLALEETTSRLTKEFQKQLEDQTRTADLAVERERIKMRKLIKALAEREKTLLQQSEAQKHSTKRISAPKTLANRDAGGSSQPFRGPLNK
jgi:hypothetical protein